jgi:hypothetical protein
MDKDAIRPGVIARDKESGVPLICTTKPGDPANKVKVNGTPVSEYDGNKKYARTSPTVECIYPDTLRKEQLESNDKTFYTFPIYRLKPIEGMDSHVLIEQGNYEEKDEEQEKLNVNMSETEVIERTVKGILHCQPQMISVMSYSKVKIIIKIRRVALTYTGMGLEELELEIQKTADIDDQEIEIIIEEPPYE